MVTVSKQDTNALRAELETVRRELFGTQEMLAHVLLEIGHEVVVSKEKVHRGIPDNAEVQVVDDLQRDAFVFYLGEVRDES